MTYRLLASTMLCEAPRRYELLPYGSASRVAGHSMPWPRKFLRAITRSPFHWHSKPVRLPYSSNNHARVRKRARRNRPVQRE